MFSFYKDEQESESISQSFLLKDNEDFPLSSTIYPFPVGYFNDIFPHFKEEKIGENIKESYINYEFKKDNLNMNKNLLENTGFTSYKPSSKIVDENPKNINITIKIENQHEKARIQDINSLEKKITQLNESQNQKKEKKLGRKSKNSDETGDHDKFYYDNLIIKCKRIILKNLYNFINYLIKKSNKDNTNLYSKNKEYILQKINQNQIKNIKVDYNLKFLDKKLKDIFSDNISPKYRNYCPEHNRKLIEKLINEGDKEKKLIFEKIFNLSFFDCLKHFRGEININELEGADRLDKFCEKFKNEKNYETKFKDFIMDYENIILKKKPRNKEKKKTKKIMLSKK